MFGSIICIYYVPQILTNSFILFVVVIIMLPNPRTYNNYTPTQKPLVGEEDVPPGKEASAAAIDAKLTAATSSSSSSNNNNDTTSKFLWIVDPIDGTTNFVHGSPLCGPSIAVSYEGEVMVGVIYAPHRKELFYAVRGYGAYVGTVVFDDDDSFRL